MHGMCISLARFDIIVCRISRKSCYFGSYIIIINGHNGLSNYKSKKCIL